MRKETVRKRTIIILFLALAALIVFINFVWSFHRPVVYVTREPIYHEYFPIGFGSAYVVQVYQGNALILLRPADRRYQGTHIIVDIETGRERMRFHSDVVRRSYSVELHGDGTVWVQRSLRAGIFSGERRFERALLEIESGRELIPFGSEYNNLHQVLNGFAIVKVTNYYRFPSLHYGLIEIESGSIVLPFEYRRMNFLSDNLVSAVIEGEDILGNIGDVCGVIDVRTGEVVWPFHYRMIFPMDQTRFPLPPSIGEGERNLVTFEYHHNKRDLIDITTGEVIIPASSEYHASFAGYGMAVVRREGVNGIGLIEIESGREIIPSGYFDSIHILNENAVLVQSGHRQATYAGLGVINIHSREEVIPIGMYQLPSPSLWFRYYEDMVLIESDEGQAIIDVSNGEEIIPFGTYNIHQLLPGGFITVSEGDYWRIKRVL